MHAARYMAWWPGLLSLWYRGEIYSLAVAILFATLLNIAILSTLIWPEWLSVWLVRGLWCFIGGASLWSFGLSVFCKSGIQKALPTAECDRLLCIAQTDYLRGEYFEAEASLHRILAGGYEDPEAALLLASILRRTGRYRQALDCLERLEKLDRAARWSIEIDSERRKCVPKQPENASEKN